MGALEETEILIQAIKEIIGHVSDNNKWNDALITAIKTHLDSCYNPSEWKQELISQYDPTDEYQIPMLNAVRDIPEDSQGLMDSWDNSAGAALGYISDSDSNVEKLRGFKNFLKDGCRPKAGEGFVPDTPTFDQGIGSFVNKIMTDQTGDYSDIPGVEFIGSAGGISLNGIKTKSFKYRFSTGAVIRIAQFEGFDSWFTAVKNWIGGEFAWAYEDFKEEWTVTRYLAHTAEFREGPENIMAQFFKRLTKHAKHFPFQLFLDPQDGRFKSIFIEIFRALDDGFRRKNFSLSQLWNHADFWDQNEDKMARAWDDWNQFQNTDFHSKISALLGSTPMQESLKSEMEAIIEIATTKLSETIGGLKTEINDSSSTEEPAPQTEEDEEEQEQRADRQDSEQSVPLDDDELKSGDTGDLDTWDPSKGSLSASEEFVDPNSDLYRYVAYYRPDTKQVEHFLVTYDQHTNRHHSTGKTLKWNDTRQTRKKAYNILICSDKVRNEFGLKPWPGSSAVCAEPAKRDPEVRRPEEDRTATPEIEVPQQLEKECTVFCKTRGRKIILDFRECPITADTLPGQDGIAFPESGIKRVVIQKKNRRDISPFTMEEISYIRFGLSTRSPDHEVEFKDYFRYLQRLMRFADENYKIAGDLSSFPLLSSDLGENIEDILDQLIKEVSFTKGITYGGRKAARTGRTYSPGSSSSDLGFSRSAGTISSFGDTVTSSTNLDGQRLNKRAKKKFSRFFRKLSSEGYKVKITSGHRYPSHQQRLVDDPAALSPADPCESDHQYGFALDINITRTPSGGTLNSQSSDEEWQPVVDIASDYGISWAGSEDRVHFSVSGKDGSSVQACKDFYGDDMGDVAKMRELEREKRDDIKRIMGIA